MSTPASATETRLPGNAAGSSSEPQLAVAFLKEPIDPLAFVNLDHIGNVDNWHVGIFKPTPEDLEPYVLVPHVFSTHFRLSDKTLAESRVYKFASGSVEVDGNVSGICMVPVTTMFDINGALTDDLVAALKQRAVDVATDLWSEQRENKAFCLLTRTGLRNISFVHLSQFEAIADGSKKGAYENAFSQYVFNPEREPAYLRDRLYNLMTENFDPNLKPTVKYMASRTLHVSVFLQIPVLSERRHRLF